MVVPCVARWRVGKAGRIRTADLPCCCLCMVVAEPLLQPWTRWSLEPVGIGFIETIGAYLLARCYIRDADDFYYVVRLFFRIALVLLPFALVEFVTGANVWRDSFAAVWEVRETGQMPPRAGLFRVQMGFDHPIPFGVCIGSTVALVYLVLGYHESFVRRFAQAGIVAMLSFMALSAGPLIGVSVQAMLLLWNGVLGGIKRRWRLLIGLSVSIALAVELVANRSLVNILTTLFVFESGSYWYRTFIWDYGSASVLNHPVFGIGLNDWERPAWMIAESMDNFWLLLAVRYGLPAACLLLLALLSIFLRLAFKKDLDDRTTAYRTAFLISLAGFVLVGWTVHYWDAALVLLLFLRVAASGCSRHKARHRGPAWCQNRSVLSRGRAFSRGEAADDGL